MVWCAKMTRPLAKNLKKVSGFSLSQSDLAEKTSKETCRAHHPRVQKPTVKATASVCALAWVLTSMCTAMITATTPEGTTQSAAFSLMVIGIGLGLAFFGCRNDSCFATDAVFPPIGTAAMSWMHGTAGHDADIVVRWAAVGSQRIAGWYGSFRGNCANQAFIGSQTVLQSIQRIQWVHLTAMMIALLYLR